MEEFDHLEKEIIITITKCSVYNVLQVKNVYKRVKSFDKTISVLKMGLTGVSLLEAIEIIINQ